MKILDVSSKIIDYIGRLICPPHCICCEEVFNIDDDRIFCSKCYEQVLSRVLDARADIENKYVDSFYYCFEYNTWYAKKIITHTKYVSSKSFLDFIGTLCKQSMNKHNLIKSVNYITYSPRRSSQIRYYGFDQSKEIAVAASTKTGIPCKQLLKRVGLSRAQKTLKTKERRKNVIGKFRCEENLKGKTVLLFDDVLTTGSTAGECARILKEQGASKVYVWAIAK